MRKKLIGYVLLIVTLIVTVLFSQEKTISTSIPPLESITKHISGNNWKILVLLPKNTNPHIFEATPQIMKNIEKSKLVILNGKDIDRWALNLIDPTKKDILILSEHLSLPENNPHYWLDPILGKEIAKIIANKLSLIDPKNKSIYLKNLNNFIKKIEDLDTFIKKEFSPYKKRELIAYHPSFYYFFKRYNIRVLSYIEEGEGKEPSLKKILEIINIIKERKIKYIVKEPFVNSPILDVIQKEAKIKIVNIDPLGYGMDYFELIKENVKILKKIFDEQNR